MRYLFLGIGIGLCLGGLIQKGVGQPLLSDWHTFNGATEAVTVDQFCRMSDADKARVLAGVRP